MLGLSWKHHYCWGNSIWTSTCDVIFTCKASNKEVHPTYKQEPPEQCFQCVCRHLRRIKRCVQFSPKGMQLPLITSQPLLISQSLLPLTLRLVCFTFLESCKQKNWQGQWLLQIAWTQSSRAQPAPCDPAAEPPSETPRALGGNRCREKWGKRRTSALLLVTRS